MLRATQWGSGGARIPSQAQPLSPNSMLLTMAPHPAKVLAGSPPVTSTQIRTLRLLGPLTPHGGVPPPG